MSEDKTKLENIKENDVFRVIWKKREQNDMKDWCFEGILIATKSYGNELIFIDTYWGIKRDGKSFSWDRLNQWFDFKYWCNLDELELKSKDIKNYYNDSDIFIIHTQHSCSENCRYYFLKKGAVKSKVKMIATIKKDIEDSKRTIDMANNNIRYRNEQLAKVESGDLEVYI